MYSEDENYYLKKIVALQDKCEQLNDKCVELNRTIDDLKKKVEDEEETSMRFFKRNREYEVVLKHEGFLDEHGSWIESRFNDEYYGKVKKVSEDE